MPEETHSASRQHVKSLRKAARGCGFSPEELCKDSASREKVQELARKVAASDGDAGCKADAAVAFEAYEATWPQVNDAQGAEGSGEAGSEEAEEAVKTGFRLRGASFLFTYNWDFLVEDNTLKNYWGILSNPT